jgi:hypothetical protein
LDHSPVQKDGCRRRSRLEKAAAFRLKAGHSFAVDITLFVASASIRNGSTE